MLVTARSAGYALIGLRNVDVMPADLTERRKLSAQKPNAYRRYGPPFAGQKNSKKIKSADPKLSRKQTALQQLAAWICKCHKARDRGCNSDRRQDEQDADACRGHDLSAVLDRAPPILMDVAIDGAGCDSAGAMPQLDSTVGAFDRIHNAFVRRNQSGGPDQVSDKSRPRVTSAAARQGRDLTERVAGRTASTIRGRPRRYDDGAASQRLTLAAVRGTAAAGRQTRDAVNVPCIYRGHDPARSGRSQ